MKLKGLAEKFMKYLSRLVEVNGLREYNRTGAQDHWLNIYQESEI